MVLPSFCGRAPDSLPFPIHHFVRISDRWSGSWSSAHRTRPVGFDSWCFLLAPAAHLRLTLGTTITSLAIVSFLMTANPIAGAEVKTAGPGNYRRILTTLTAGDTLRLEPGLYPNGLPITNCRGREDAWITVEGPPMGVAEIRQSSVANCVELRQSSFIALKRLTIQGGGPDGIPGLFGISAQGGVKNSVHHVLIEDCSIRDWNTSQQAVGISTKTPTWGWTIRRNTIVNCGTGLYLGGSDGSAPFIQGVIENNLVQNPIGYCLEIKFQNSRPLLDEMPTQPGSTVLRHNVFIKDGRPSPDGNRPNVLVGGFPDAGPGSQDRYEIYGNVFFHNPRESLLQASGRVSIHDNLFVDCPSPGSAAITLRHHDLPLKQARIYNNTICASVCGIKMPDPPRDSQAIVGNVIFADKPMTLHRSITPGSSNITGTIADAATHLQHPGTEPGQIRLVPKPGHCQGPPLDLSDFQNDIDFHRDFDQQPKGDFRFRGAYADDSDRSRWQPSAACKELRY